MTPTSGPRANGSPREWDSSASRIEELELRLELERGRVQIRDLKALLAVYQQDNDRLRSFLNHTFRERSPAEAHAHASRSVGVDVSVGSSLPSAPIHHSHAYAHGPSATSPALQRAPWDRAASSSSSWLSAQQQQHQQEREEGGMHREVDQRAGGSGGWRGLRTSCDFCTGSKIRCDGSKPTCGNCQQRGIDCHYSAKRRPGPKPSRGASEDLSHAPPARRPRITPYDRMEPQTTTNTRTPLRQPPIGRFYTTHIHTHAPSTSTTNNTHSFSPIATQLSSSSAAAAESDGSWRASFDDAQVMSLSPPHSPPDIHTRRVAF